MIFDIDELDHKLDSFGKGIFVPKDHIDRAIGSFIYCNKRSCLNEILEKYLPPFNSRNDMEALGFFSNQSKYFFSFPNESFFENQNLWSFVNPDYCNGLFDAAAIGQYCLGVDPKNNPFVPTKNLFINEKSRVDFNKVIINSDGFNLNLKLPSSEKVYKLYNLHIHSKRIKLAIELIKKGPIFKALVNKEQIIIAHRYKYFLGFMFRFIYLLKLKIKKIIVYLLNIF